MKQKLRNIACLESLWDKKTENRLNIIPLLELASKTLDVKFSHLSCNTEGEFEYNLGKLCKRNYGILYLGFHGSGGKIHLDDGTEIDLLMLSDMMGGKFQNWIVHFGSCGVFRKKKDWEYFLKETQVKIVTGYEKNVGWIESAAMELLLLEAFINYENPKVACKNIWNKFPDLASKTGFCYYPD